MRKEAYIYVYTNKINGKTHSIETKNKISKANKGIKRKLDKWLTETGDIVYMYAGPVKRFHKNWIKIE